MSNSIRQTVASQICGLGMVTLSKGFKWDALSFGWSLSDVLGALPPINNKNDFPPSSCRDVTNEEDQEVADECEENVTIKVKKDVKAKVTSSSKDQKKNKKKVEKEVEKETEDDEEELTGFAKAAKEPLSAGVSLAELLLSESHIGLVK